MVFGLCWVSAVEADGAKKSGVNHFQKPLDNSLS
jgi:hypothetical protein